MKSRGRPRISQVQLRDGFYIEVRNKGIKNGMKIRSESKKTMEDAARLYSYKEVIILGEYKNGIPVGEVLVG